MRYKKGPFGSDKHGRFRRIRLPGKQGLYLPGRVKLPVEPFHWQHIRFGKLVAGEHPSDMVSLRPGIAVSFRRFLPRLLDLGHDGLRRFQTEAFPYGVKYMTSDVSGPSRSEILPRPPYGRMIDIGGIGAHRCGPYPKVPVQMGGDILSLTRARAGQPVGLYRCRTIRAEVCMLDLSYRAVLDHLYRRAITFARGMLCTKLCYYPCLYRRFGQLSHLRHIMAHRFLTVHVLSVLYGPIGNGEMVMVRHRHIDRVNYIALLFKELTPIGIRSGIGKDFRCLLQVVRIYITKCYDLYIGMFLKVLKVVPSHSPDPYTGMFQFALWRCKTHGGIYYKRGRERRCRNRAQEFSSRY